MVSFDFLDKYIKTFYSNHLKMQFTKMFGNIRKIL